VGYLLLAFSANSLEGTQALLFYLIIYMITSLCIWSVVLSLETLTSEKRSKTLIDLASIASTNPFLGFGGMLSFFCVVYITCRSLE